MAVQQPQCNDIIESFSVIAMVAKVHEDWTEKEQG